LDAEASDLDILLADIEKAEDYGPALSSKVAEGFMKTLERPLSKETVNSLKLKSKIPENCKIFAVPKMNSEIWTQLPAQAKISDLKNQTHLKSLSLALSSLSRIAEIAAKSSSNQSNDSSKEIIKIALDTANVLGDEFQEVCNKRRLDVRRHMNAEYSAVCSAKIPIGEYLFGSDLNEALKSSKAAAGVIRKSMTSIRPHNFKPYFRGGPSTTLNRFRPSSLLPKRGSFQGQSRGRFNQGYQNPIRQFRPNQQSHHQ